jgi:hypothetical protein
LYFVLKKHISKSSSLKIPKEQSEATEEQTNMAKRRRTDKHGQKKNRQTWPKEKG